MINLVILAMAIASIVGVIIYWLFDYYRQDLNPIYDRVSKLINSRNEKSKDNTLIKSKDLNILYGPFLGLLLGFTVTLGVGGSEYIVVVFAAIGLGVNLFIKNNIKKTEENRLRSEVAILYEVIDFYTSAGYTLPQSMQLGASILPELNPIINKVLSEWPQGSFGALQILSDNIELNEAIILVSILQYIDESGIDYGRSTIEEEARQLESVRKTLSEMHIINKPLYYSVYRILPVASLASIVLGPLVYRLVIMMQVINSGF